MGQYYRAVIEIDGEKSVYNTRLKNPDDSIGPKLTEHSWFLNKYVGRICTKIYQESSARLWWVGDYFEGNLPKTDINAEDVWTDQYLEDPGIRLFESVDGNSTFLKEKFLCNIDEKVYIDMGNYFDTLKSTSSDGGVMHPLPLLCACGNGLGGGDYHGNDLDLVGSWAGQEIAITDSAMEGFTEVLPSFYEIF